MNQKANFIKVGIFACAALRPAGSLFENNGNLRFPEIEPEDLTEFMVVEVAGKSARKRFVLKIRLEAGPWRDERDARLMQKLLTRDNLQAYLKAILFDTVERFSSKTEGILENGNGSGSGGSTLFSDISIEDVIRSCTEDPSRIDEINKALKIFEKTGWVDEGFMQFWSVFVLAEVEAREELTDG